MQCVAHDPTAPSLAQLPATLLQSVLSHLPADVRVRCAAVCRVPRAVCARPDCGAVSGGPANTTLQLCAACQQTRYCSRSCQLAHWPAHKAACKAARGKGDAKAV